MILAAPLALVAGTARAASLDVSVDAPSARPSDGFQVTVQFEAEDGVELVVGDSSDFEVHQNVSTCGTSIQCIGTQCTTSKSCNYGYLYLPRSEGKLTIPAFSLVHRGTGQTVASSEPIAVEASASATPKSRGRPQRPGMRSPRMQPQAQAQPRSGSSGSGKVLDGTVPSVSAADARGLEKLADYDLFILPHMDRQDAYLNEPVLVDFLLYINPQGDLPVQELSVSGGRMQLPDMTGFRKEEVESQPQQAEVRIKGKTYRTALLARYVLVPMQSGNGTIAQAKATIPAVVYTFDPFWGRVPRQDTIEVWSPPVVLPVKAAPLPRPAGFDDANVGRFELSPVEVPPPQVAGSWVMLKYEITGTGNLLSVQVPRIPDSDAIEQRDAHVDRSAVVRNEQGIQGKVSVQIPFRVKRPGTHDLGSLRLAFLDPASGRYQEATAKIPEVVATNVEGSPDAPAVAPGSELQGIIADGSLRPAEERTEFPPLWWTAGFGALLPLLYLLAAAGRGVVRAAGRDTDRRREKLAVAQARRELTEARTHAAQGQTDRFYAAILKALSLYLEGRFGISVGSATHDVVVARLLALGVPEGLAQAVRTELESAEFGRFSPSRLQAQDMTEALERTGDMLAGLDRFKPRGGKRS
jgi:hypothetical protein